MLTEEYLIRLAHISSRVARNYLRTQLFKYTLLENAEFNANHSRDLSARKRRRCIQSALCLYDNLMRCDGKTTLIDMDRYIFHRSPLGAAHVTDVHI